jgi:hypothetical protein
MGIILNKTRVYRDKIALPSNRLAVGGLRSSVKPDGDSL